MSTLTLSDRLRRIRKDAGCDQKTMSKRLGLGDTSWQRLELEGRAPKGDVLRKLVEIGYSSDWLLTGQGEMRRAEPSGHEIAGCVERITAAEEIVDLYELPISPETRAKEPRLEEIYRDVSAIATRGDLPLEVRGRADRLLALAFKDPAAHARREGRFEDAMTDLRGATTTMREIEHEVGWKLPTYVAMHLRDMIYLSHVPKEQVLPLVEAMKEAFARDGSDSKPK